jgi:GNAT superfamily N-acetyltransferase
MARVDGPSGVPSGMRLVRVVDEPEWWRPADAMCTAAWPEFMLHDPVANRCWGHLREDWPEFQLVLLDESAAEPKVAAAAQAAPLTWSGVDEELPAGWDEQFERSVEGLDSGAKPNTLGAIQICVASDRRGQGLSAVMLEAMTRNAAGAGFGSLVACVRPTEKVRYPLMPIDAYAAWRRPDGLPFDPWLRVHARAGARLVRGSSRSMTIAGSVAEWAEWTGLGFPVSGPYTVDGALAPVDIDVAADRGVYFDPNVWMVHDLSARRGG